MDEEVVLSHEGPGMGYPCWGWALLKEIKIIVKQRSSRSYFHLVHLSSYYAVRVLIIKKGMEVFGSLCEEESFPVKSYIFRWSKKRMPREVGGCTRALERSF
eukprot:7661081-Ditylum_brightwellii.AAC.1